MEANIDGYAQMRVSFTEDELIELEKQRRVDGEIWCFAQNWQPDEIRLWEEKTAYLISLIPEALKVMGDKKFVSLGSTDTKLRSILMSLKSSG